MELDMFLTRRTVVTFFITLDIIKIFLNQLLNNPSINSGYNPFVR